MHVRGYYGEGPIIAPPRVMATESPVMGFVVCPAMLQHAFLANCNVQLIYRAAYERACAAPGVYAAGGDVGGIANGGYASGLAAALVLGRVAARSALEDR